MSEMKKLAIVSFVWLISIPFAQFWAGVLQGLSLSASPFSVMEGLFATALYFALPTQE